MNKPHSKMLIGGMCIVRVLLLRVLSNYPMPDKNVPLNTTRKKNMHLVASMIYQSFAKITMATLPISTYNIDTHLVKVQPDRRIFPLSKPLQAKSSLTVAETHDPLSFVLGYENVRQMPNFLVDPQGIDHVQSLISTFIDNVMTQSELVLQQRKRNSAIIKLIKKRKIIDQIKTVIPEYYKPLKDLEKKSMNKYKIQEFDIQKLLKKVA